MILFGTSRLHPRHNGSTKKFGLAFSGSFAVIVPCASRVKRVRIEFPYTVDVAEPSSNHRRGRIDLEQGFVEFAMHLAALANFRFNAPTAVGATNVDVARFCSEQYY